MAGLTTTSAQSYSSGATMGTFRVLNRGGNWNEFYASYTNGSWSCVQLPGSVVTNITVPNPSEPDSVDVTITGGTFVLNSFYSFTGTVPGMAVSGGMAITGGIAMSTGV